MVRILPAFAVGLLFGLGLLVSQMANPGKVLAFLDVFGPWDASLARVMAGAVAASSLGYLIVKRLGAPLLSSKFDVPTRRDLDPRLLAGAAIFGIGWGLVGLCPGPALTLLPFGLWQALVFVAAMMLGMLSFRLVPANWPKPKAKPARQEAEA